MRRDRPGNAIQILDGNCAFEAIWPSGPSRRVPFLHEALNTWTIVIAGVNQVEVRRSPRFEPPSEGCLVKHAAPLHIVGMNGELARLLGMARAYSPCRSWSNPAIPPINVAKASRA